MVTRRVLQGLGLGLRAGQRMVRAKDVRLSAHTEKLLTPGGEVSYPLRADYSPSETTAVPRLFSRPREGLRFPGYNLPSYPGDCRLAAESVRSGPGLRFAPAWPGGFLGCP